MDNKVAEDDSLMAIMQRITDFFESEDIYVMGVSDARPTLNGNAEGPLRSHRRKP